MIIDLDAIDAERRERIISARKAFMNTTATTIDPNKPTARQLEVLAFMRIHMLERGAPPTIRDIMRHFGWTSPNGTMGHIKALIRKGLVQQSGVYRRGGFIPVVPAGCCPTCGQRLPKEPS